MEDLNSSSLIDRSRKANNLPLTVLAIANPQEECFEWNTGCAHELAQGSSHCTRLHDDGNDSTSWQLLVHVHHAFVVCAANAAETRQQPHSHRRAPKRS